MNSETAAAGQGRSNRAWNFNMCISENNFSICLFVLSIEFSVSTLSLPARSREWVWEMAFDESNFCGSTQRILDESLKAFPPNGNEMISRIFLFFHFVGFCGRISFCKELNQPCRAKRFGIGGKIFSHNSNEMSSLQCFSAGVSFAEQRMPQSTPGSGVFYVHSSKTFHNVNKLRISNTGELQETFLSARKDGAER